MSLLQLFKLRAVQTWSFILDQIKKKTKLVHDSTYRWRIILAIFLFVLLGSILMYFHYPLIERSDLYIPPTTIINESIKKPEDLFALTDKRISLYHSLNKELNGNILTTSILCGIGLLLLLSKVEDVKIPYLDINVNRKLACWFLPFIFLYTWLSFGYTLNSCIDSRIACMNLINSDEKIVSDLPIKGSVEDNEKYLTYHYTISRASELEDHGLIDCWFFNFRNSKLEYPVRIRGWYNRIVPICAMIWYGMFYGLLHALIYMLPYSISSRPNLFHYRALLYLSTLLIIASHSSFYIAGAHKNWFQICILMFMLYFIFSLKRIAESHWHHQASEHLDKDKANA